MRHLIRNARGRYSRAIDLCMAGLALALLVLVLAACGGGAAPEEGPVAAPAPEAGAAPAQSNTAPGAGQGESETAPGAGQGMSDVESAAGQGISTPEAAGDEGVSTPEAATSQGISAVESAAGQGMSTPEAGGGEGRANARRLSFDNLASVPNGDYRWIAMVDVNAVVAGEVPYTVSEENYQPGPAYESSREWFGRETEASGYEEMDLNGSLLREQLGLSLEDLDAVVALADHWLVIQGRFDAEEVARALNDGGENRQEQPFGQEISFIGEAGGYRAWRLSDRYSTWWYVFLAQDEIYVSRFYTEIETIEEFVGETTLGLLVLAPDDKLVRDPANPMVRVLERVGTGGLVSAWNDFYCSSSYGIPMDGEGCLAIALALSADGDSSVKVRWLLLYDRAENAQALGTRVREEYRAEGVLEGEEPLNLSVEVDGEFVVMEMEISAEVGREVAENFVVNFEGEMW